MTVMDTDHATPTNLTALCPEFGHLTPESGSVGRIAHRAAAEPGVDAA
jgi:hypothetical protein